MCGNCGEGCSFRNLELAMQLGATMMSSFLVNSALILLAATAVVQFCAQAFEAYAQESAIQEVFGNEILHLQSVRPIFKNNVFIYIMLAFSALTALWLMLKGPQGRRRRRLSLEEAYAQG
jgi:LMBR1 domain-containing protein 1